MISCGRFFSGIACFDVSGGCVISGGRGINDGCVVSGRRVISDGCVINDGRVISSCCVIICYTNVAQLDGCCCKALTALLERRIGVATFRKARCFTQSGQVMGENPSNRSLYCTSVLLHFRKVVLPSANSSMLIAITVTNYLGDDLITRRRHIRMSLAEALIPLSPLDQFQMLWTILVELWLAGGTCRIFRHVIFAKIVHGVSQAVASRFMTSCFAGSTALLSSRQHLRHLRSPGFLWVEHVYSANADLHPITALPLN